MAIPDSNSTSTRYKKTTLYTPLLIGSPRIYILIRPEHSVPAAVPIPAHLASTPSVEVNRVNEHNKIIVLGG